MLISFWENISPGLVTISNTHTHTHTHRTGLQEIYDWVVTPGNQEEVIVVHINDESPSSDWGHISLIQDPVREIFGELLFTPENKKTLFPHRW